jgi:bifunctional non-homologous end joining protein LigD
MGELSFGRYTVELSNEDKVLFPDLGFTKGDLIDYYRRMARYMLPHLEDRPLSLERFPDGIAAGGFFQQDRPGHFPDWIRSVAVERREQGREHDFVDHVIADNEATLAYLANQGVITLHAWLARAPTVDCPDRLIFDLDPPDDDFAAVRDAARRVRDLMDELELSTWLMTTGSRGLHVLVPLDGSESFDDVRDFARDSADLLASRFADTLTVEHRKDRRAGRLFLDTTRNAYGQTTVTPYSVRAKPGASVATPLDWHELGNASLTSRSYTVGNVRRRLGQKDDPWQDIRRHAHALGPARRRLSRILGD